MGRIRASLVGVGLLLLLPRAASATLENVGESALFALTPTVTFAAVRTGAYADVPFQFGSGVYAGAYIVFGSTFQGQTLVLTDSNSQANVAEPSAPGQTLGLDFSAYNYVEVTNDAASPSNPVLAGGPSTFREPVSILLTKPTAAIGLTAGYLDTTGTLTIDAYNAAGTEIGSVTNTGTGFETFGLLDPDGALISGLTIQSTDPAGFGINDIYLATAIPEPSAWVALAVGGAGLAAARRRARRLCRRVGRRRIAALAMDWWVTVGGGTAGAAQALTTPLL
jgi:hypothetical protein